MKFYFGKYAETNDVIFTDYDIYRLIWFRSTGNWYEFNKNLYNITNITPLTKVHYILFKKELELGLQIIKSYTRFIRDNTTVY